MSKSKRRMDEYCFNNLGEIEKYLRNMDSCTDSVAMVVDFLSLTEEEIRDADKAISLIRRKLKKCYNVREPRELNDLIRVKRVVEHRFIKFEDDD